MAKTVGQGPQLSREHLIALAKKSVDNAQELVEEAELLFNNGRWARTVFLCQAAGEEFGKAVQCFTAIMDHARGVLDFAKFRKRFLSHRSKTTTIRFFEALVNPNTDGDQFMDEIKGLGNEVPVLLQGRNATLYSDIFSDGTVFAPTDVIPKNFARAALTWAKGRVAMSDAMISPILDSMVVKERDEELRKRYDEFMAVMKDPKKLEALRKKVMPD